MQHIGLLFTILTVFLNLWGLALVTGLIFPNRWVALVSAPWLVSTAFFCAESIHGFGTLRGVGTLGTLLSVGLIGVSTTNWPERATSVPRFATFCRNWKKEFAPPRLIPLGLVFFVVFGYVFAWRFAFPDIDGSSEKIADLGYICSYLTGGTIPVRDAWLSPYTSAHYYSFQHFAAALMGRLSGLDPGTTYNLAFCLLTAFVGVSFSGFVFLVTERWWIRIVVISAFLVGGTGATIVAHLTEKTVQPWSAMRYVGSAAYDKEPIGPWLKKYSSEYEKMDMPGEPFSYSIYLGDYHAPLSGYYLLGVAAISVFLWERYKLKRYVILAGCTLTWSILANTWTLPLQAFGIATWVIYRRKEWRTIVPSLMLGSVLIGLAAASYLTAFGAATAGYNTSFKWVAAGQHTPPLLFCLFLLPTIGLAILSLFGDNKMLRYIGGAGIVLLLISEFIYVDDIYSGMYERFNTTLKWWPWISSAVLLVCGPLILQTVKYRWMRVVAIVLVAYPTLYFVDLIHVWVSSARPSFGRFEGTAYLQRDLAAKLMLERLKMEQPGLVVERPTQNAFTNSACLPLFAGHHMWMGWLGHEQLWRGYREDLAQRQERLFHLYKEPDEHTGNFLSGELVDYVLWYQKEDTTDLWTVMDKGLAANFKWVEIFTTPEGKKIGFWRRKA